MKHIKNILLTCCFFGIGISLFGQSHQLYLALAEAIFQKGVQVMVWENEYSPKVDIISWGTQKAAAVAAFGADTEKGKLIADADMKDYIAVVNRIRKDEINTHFGLSIHLKSLSRDAKNWRTMKKAYTSACPCIIRQLFEQEYRDGTMNAVGNWTLYSEMYKLIREKEGTAIPVPAEGTKCDTNALHILIWELLPEGVWIEEGAICEQGGIDSWKTKVTLTGDSRYTFRFRLLYEKKDPITGQRLGTDWNYSFGSEKETVVEGESGEVIGIQFQWKEKREWVNLGGREYFQQEGKDWKFRISSEEEPVERIIITPLP